MISARFSMDFMERRNVLDQWRVSLHGGHSGEFCDHAEGTLREMLEAAVLNGYRVFGVTEHAPRNANRFLYSEERKMGWTLAKVQDDFKRYCEILPKLAEEFADRLVILRGFEAEVVPADSYLSWMQGYRAKILTDGQTLFDYCVGSVHYVDEMQIDGSPNKFRAAVNELGGLEALAVRYYETVAEMIAALKPEVVGHLDLLKKHVVAIGEPLSRIETSKGARAAEQALEAAKANNSILDLNTSGWRKGLGEPYPAPWLVKKAHSMGVPFCFGDDSHRASEVGAGLDEARLYLLQNGVDSICCLVKENGKLRRDIVPL